MVQCQAVVEVVLSEAVVDPESQAQEITIHAVHMVGSSPCLEGIAPKMGMKVLAIEVQVPGCTEGAAPAYAGCFMGQCEDMAHSDTSCPVAGIGPVARAATTAI